MNKETAFVLMIIFLAITIFGEYRNWSDRRTNVFGMAALAHLIIWSLK